MKVALQTIVSRLTHYQHHVLSGAIILGFVWDSLTLGRPDRLFENSVFLGYLLISLGAIFALNFWRERESGSSLFVRSLMQFSFGNLAGGLFILYAKSGTFVGSAFFFFLLGGLIVGNEFFRTRYSRLYFNVTVWSFLLTLYATLIFPLIFGSIGVHVFLMSVCASLIITFTALFFIYYVSRDSIPELKKVSISVSGVSLLFVILYYLNIIPPVPLALKDIGIYHSLNRGLGGYEVSYEKPPWYQFMRSTNKTYTTRGRTATCLSSVFVPGEITVPIFHRFEYFDTRSSSWITKAYVPLAVSSGREDGYRAWSVTSQLQEGEWRCSVETERGSLIGRVKFDVVLGAPIITSEVI